MNNYWTGVVVGSLIALILTVCGLFYYSNRTQVLEKEMVELKQRQEKLEAWYKENETVMQTYKFFNQSWQAIIDMSKFNIDSSDNERR